MFTGSLLDGAAEQIESQDVVASIGWSSLVHRLVHVADFKTPITCMMLFHADAYKDTVLVETAALAPIRIVECNK